MRHVSFTLLAIAAIAAEEQIPSTSTTSTEPAETLVITAARQPTTQAGVAAGLTVLDDEQDRRDGYAQSWTQRLRRTPGVDILSRAGGLDGGGLPGIRLRGTQNNADTQVLVDGIPWNDASDIEGGPSLLSLQSAGVERIEVVRGAQSGLYGSRAVGGVVNLISERPSDEHHGHLRLEGGSFNTVSADAAASGPLLRGDGQRPLLGYSAGISAIDSDGFSATTLSADGDPGNAENDSVQRLGGNLRVETNPNDLTSLYAAVMLGSAEHGFDDGDPNDKVSVKTEGLWRGALGGSVGLPLESTLAFDVAHTSGHRETISASGFADSNLDSADNYGSVRWTVPVSGGVSLTPGVDVLHQQADGAGVNDRSQSTTGLWLQALAVGEQWEASAVARHERISDGDHPTTFRIGAALLPWHGALRLHAAVGTAFRAPSLYQRYVDDGFTLGNPDLEAQRSWSWEVGMGGQPTEGMHAESTLFVTHYRNRIAYDFSGPVGTYVNEDDTARSIGVENEATWSVPGTPCEVFGIYTWQNTEDQNGKTFIGLPRHKGSLGVTADEAIGWATLAADGVGPRRDSGSETLPGYVTCSAVLGWHAKAWLSVYARGENLLDKAHSDSHAFGEIVTSQPRSVFIGAEATY